MFDAFGLALGTDLALLLVKTGEMLYHSICLMRSAGRHGPTTVMSQWPVSEHLPAWLGAAFRLPLLVAIAVVLLPFQSGTALLRASSVVLLLSIWMQIFQALHSKFVLGPADSQFRRRSVWLIARPAQIDSEKPIRDAVLFVGGLIFTTIIAYAGAYYSEVQLCGSTFSGLKDMPDALYFSVVTFATVGYGDILPVGTWPRLLCASEIIAGISIVGLFVLSYSLEPPDGTRRS